MIRKTTFLAAALAALSLFGGGKIYDKDGNPQDLESTNLLMQVAQDLTTVEDLASFGGTVTNVTVDGVSVMTNKTAAISSYGRLKRLGKYIWEATTEGENYVAATNVLQKHYPVYGGCSAVHAGSIHGRTYDWYYDKCAEFVVRNPAKNGKFASIGIATSFKSLTDDFLETGKWHPSMYEIPFAWVDGMNEKGVVLQTNVTPLDETKSSTWRTYSPDKCMVFLIVRQVLDNFDNAEDAAEWIAEKLYLPPTFTFDCHIMVSDRENCFIVEDGHIIRNSATTPTDIMTNFRLRNVPFVDGLPSWSNVEEYGMGLERYEDARTNGFDNATVAGMSETMKRLYYTRAYDKTLMSGAQNLFWYTEYVGDHTSEGYGILKVMDAKTEEGRAKFTTYIDKLVDESIDEHTETSPNYRGGHSWQTVHMCVYDQKNLVLRIWTQEDDASAMMFTLKKNPADFKVDMYKDYADETVTNGILKTANDFTYASLTNTDISTFANVESNSIVGKISNSKVRITVDGTKMSVMDGSIERWSFDKDDMNGKQDLLPYPTNAIPASVIVGTVGAPDYENVSNKAVNALQRFETTDVIRVANAYADQYSGQAPDYANVSNLAINALQKNSTVDVIKVATDYADRYADQAPDYSNVSNLSVNALQRSETCDVIKVATDYADRYAGQAPDYANVSNLSVNALQRSETGSVIKVAMDYADTYAGQAPDYANVSNLAINALQKSGTTDVIKVATDYADKYADQAPDYANVSNTAVNALQRSETGAVIKVATDYSDRYAGQAPDYANVSNLSVNALQRSETGAVIKVATDYADKYANQSPDYSTVSNLAVNALQKSETGNVIKVATDYADRYADQAPDYSNVSNMAVNALQRSETGSVIKVATDYSDKYANQAPDYSNVSNLSINALQKSETGNVIKVATDYADRYANQAPDYSTVSNKAMTAIQEHQSLANYLTKAETTDVIRVANKYADQYAGQAPDYMTISNKAMTALQEHQSLVGYLQRSETADVIKVATDYADKYADQAPDYDTVSNKAMTAIQSHQSLDNYLTKGETTDVIRVANGYADQYANQAPDYNTVSNKAMTALQEHQSLSGYLPRSETGDVIKVATDYADANKVQKLVNVSFDFENGSNFTKRVYEVLTNVIDRMGGSVTNPPVFED